MSLYDRLNARRQAHDVDASSPAASESIELPAGSDASASATLVVAGPQAEHDIVIEVVGEADSDGAGDGISPDWPAPAGTTSLSTIPAIFRPRLRAASIVSSV